MSVLIDIKYAMRLLMKAPKFTAMTLSVLVGGLTISLFTFSFLYSMVYKPLPIPEAESAKSISIFYDGNYNLITAFEYMHVKDQLTNFDEFGVYDNRPIRVSSGDAGKDIYGSLVQGGFFEFSRTQPILGRVIQEADTLAGASPVAVISYDTWQNEMSGDDNVLSQTMILNGIKTDVIGVMPKGYHFPNTSKIWLPLAGELLKTTPDKDSYYYAYGRIKEGVSISAAQEELGQAVNQVYQQNVKRFSLPELEKSSILLSFQLAQVGGQGGIVFTFLNAISWLILLLACINVGNLLLARSIERQKETAIRAALGATTKRLVSQLMWEGVIISTIGGILSLLLVGAALDYTEIVFHSWMPGGGSYWWHWGMDVETFSMGIAFTLITIILAAFLPAWRSANQDINTTLRDGTRGAQSKKAGKVSRILVTTQVFLVALLMLIGSISAFISHKFINLDMGDNYEQVITARMTIPEIKYPEEQQQLALFQILKQQIEQHPQVLGVVAQNWMGQMPMTLVGGDYASDDDKPVADILSVIGNTETIGINLVAGRQFTHQDKTGNRQTVLISQSMAKRFWPAEPALGKSFSIKIDDVEETVFVIGVVTDRLNLTTMFGRLDAADEVYVSGLQFINSRQILYYRIADNTENAEEIYYRAMFNTDRNIELSYAVQPANENRNLMRESMGIMSNVTFGTGFFALLLAMVGIYGLTANAVAQRTHEVGIRRAVGATDKSILQMFLKQGARQLVVGLSLALVIFALISFGFHKFTEGFFPIYTYFMMSGTVVVGLSAVVMFAIYTPSLRAVKMEPSLALRYE